VAIAQRPNEAATSEERRHDLPAREGAGKSAHYSFFASSLTA
jgi:hypothetical protein